MTRRSGSTLFAKLFWSAGLNGLTFIILCANSADDNLRLYFLFSTPLPPPPPGHQKTGFGISCNLSPKEAICMRCQCLFSGKKKEEKYLKCLLKFLSGLPSVKNTREQIQSFINIFSHISNRKRMQTIY